VAVRQAALVSDESALEACLRRCAIRIDDLYLYFYWTDNRESPGSATVVNLTGVQIVLRRVYLVNVTDGEFCLRMSVAVHKPEPRFGRHA